MQSKLLRKSGKLKPTSQLNSRHCVSLLSAWSAVSIHLRLVFPARRKSPLNLIRPLPLGFVKPKLSSRFSHPFSSGCGHLLVAQGLGFRRAQFFDFRCAGAAHDARFDCPASCGSAHLWRGHDFARSRFYRFRQLMRTAGDEATADDQNQQLGYLRPKPHSHPFQGDWLSWSIASTSLPAVPVDCRFNS